MKENTAEGAFISHCLSICRPRALVTCSRNPEVESLDLSHIFWSTKSLIISMTPMKDPKTPRSKVLSENFNPNCPSPKQSKWSSRSSSKHKKPVSVSPNRAAHLTAHEKKFVLAKNCVKEAPPLSVYKCKERNSDLKRCLCVAYDAVRASSQKDFTVTQVGKDDSTSRDEDSIKDKHGERSNFKGLESGSNKNENGYSEIASELPDQEDFELSDGTCSTRIRKMRSRVLEEARSSIPESGTGRVRHLVQAFERLLSIRTSVEVQARERDKNPQKCPKWLQPNALETDFFPSIPLPDFVFNANGSSIYSSLGSSSGSISTRTSGLRRSRRNSSGSSGRNGREKWKKQLRPTHLQPFKLRTEQRGVFKNEEFHKKIEDMLQEEKKQRIPIAHGLPWTTDEPECLVKPPVKESTTPLDIQLHSDVRAVERAEFDQLVIEKLSLMEEYRMERERQQKLEEDEEIRRFRRELVPRAQPMPYFDRPFIPRRSEKLPTIPKEPRFHVQQHKKIKCMSWNDMSGLYQQNL